MSSRFTIILLFTLGACASDDPGTNARDAGAVDAAPTSLADAEVEDSNAAPCGERSYEECEKDERGSCLGVRARRIAYQGGQWCHTGEVIETCRQVGGGCSDGDAVTESCDADGGIWVSPQTCVPAWHQVCQPAVDGPVAETCAEN